MSLSRGRRGSLGGDLDIAPSSSCENCWQSWAASISSSLMHADSANFSSKMIGSLEEWPWKRDLLRLVHHMQSKSV